MGRYDYLCELETIIEIDKMNDRHDPKTGRFTFKPGSEAAFVPAKTTHEAVLYATQKLGFYDVDYGNMDLETINHVNLEITRIQEKYPEVRGAVQYLDVYEENDAYACTVLDSSNGTMAIELSRHDFGNGIAYLKEKYERDAAIEQVPRNTDFRAIIWHEYGHVIANIIRKKSVGLGSSEFKVGFNPQLVTSLKTLARTQFPYQEWVLGAMDALALSMDGLARGVSENAKNSVGELFADSFAEVNVAPAPRKEAVTVVRKSGWYRT